VRIAIPVALDELDQRFKLSHPTSEAGVRVGEDCRESTRSCVPQHLCILSANLLSIGSIRRAYVVVRVNTHDFVAEPVRESPTQLFLASHSLALAPLIKRDASVDCRQRSLGRGNGRNQSNLHQAMPNQLGVDFNARLLAAVKDVFTEVDAAPAAV